MSREAEQQRELNRRYNESQNSGLSAGAVGAVGAAASAALLYRSGGIKKLSSAMDRGYRFLGEASTIYKNNFSKDDWTISNVKSAYREMQAKWKEIGKAFEEHDIRVRTEASDSLFSYVHQMENIRHSSRSLQDNLMTTARYTNPAMAMFRRSRLAKQMDRNQTIRMENFIERISRATGDAGRFEREVFEAGKSIRTEEEQLSAEKIANAIRSRMKKKQSQALKKKTEAFKKKQELVKKQVDTSMEKAMDIETLEKTFGTVRNSDSLSSKMWKGLTTDHAATMRDFFEAVEKKRVEKNRLSYMQQKGTEEIVANGKKIFRDVQAKRVLTDTEQQMLNLREHFRKLDKEAAGRGEKTEFERRFLDITPDAKAFRKANGELYTFTSASEIKEDFLQAGANTLPGKILKLRHLEYDESKAPAFIAFLKGTKDPFLAARMNRPDSANDGRLDANYFQIGKRLFRGSADGGLEEVLGMEDMKLVSGRYGPFQNLTKQIAGDTRYKTASNRLFRALDIGQSLESDTFVTQFKSIVSKFNDENWIGNIAKSIFSPTDEEAQILAAERALANSPDAALAKESRTHAYNYLSKAGRIEGLIKENTYELSYDAVQKLMANASDGAQEYFRILQSGNGKDMLASLMELHKDRIEKNFDTAFLNEDLNALLHRYDVSPQKTINSIQQKTDRMHMHVGSSVFDFIDLSPGNEYADFADQLRVEIGKEAFLQHAADTAIGASERNYSSVLELVQNSGLQSRDVTNTNRLAHLAMFQERTRINARIPDQSIEELWGQVEEIDYIARRSEEEVDKGFQEMFGVLKKETISDLDMFASDTFRDIATPSPYSEFIHARKGIGVLDILNSLNDATKAKATAKSFFKQWGAGRENMEDVTTYTMAPYFFLSRLSDEMNKLGLGFSRETTGSTWDIIKGATTKRILPAVLAWNYFDWMDDTSQEVTGTSITGAFVNGIGNVDLGVRKGLDTLGITPWLNELKSINPIMQYWGDKTSFMSYDERKEWYENGYEPVRKGAWWTFGGVNEARGAEIQYWQPNLVRRVNSDYFDKSMYDGYFDKWSHSWLPTPTNPLSPLFALLDPYWLERKHEDDRPYPVSGPLFQEGTPWGALFNDNIGELIKPQKELHPWRLQNGIDAKVLIHGMNEWIHAKARDIGKQNMFVLHGGEAIPVRFTSFDAPTPDTKVYSVQQTGNGWRVSDAVYGGYAGGTALYGGVDDSGAAMYGLGGSSSGIAGSGIGVSGTPSAQAKALGAGFNRIKNGAQLMQYEGMDPTFHDIIGNLLFGDGTGVPQDGAVVTNAKGEVGIFAVNDGRDRSLSAGNLGIDQSLELDRLIHGDPVGIFSSVQNIREKFSPKKLLKSMNEDLRSRANLNEFDESEGIVTPEKLSMYRPSTSMSLLEDASTVADLINQEKGAGFVSNAAQSARLIGGIYGYMAGAAFGMGVQDDKKIANSSDMTSFSRSFWDSNLGGAGGGVMEIVRRFIPNYRRNNEVNPLMNEMPDWLPSRFRTGDPFTRLPNGEARLPGKGYESLNPLHSDQFGEYGAFDRFKILADIAPHTPEYKIWRDIAKKTIADPQLKAEMEEISARVAEQGKKHDFYNYKVKGKDFGYKEVVVSKVMGYGKFKSGDTVYKLAGARVQGNADETMSEVLGRYIHVGDTVTVAYDTNEATQKNKDADSSLNVAVFNAEGNVANQMMEAGDAVKRKSDNSVAATLVNLSSFQRAIGYASEVVAHADIPWLSDQFLRVRTPLESYDAEQVSGTPYQTWEHPIDTFVMPAFERAIHERSVFDRLETMAFNYLTVPGKLSKMQLHGANIAYMFTNRGAFIGGALANLIAPGDATAMHKGAKLTSNLVAMGHLLQGGSSYADQMTSGAMLGSWIAEKLEKSKGKGAIAGALLSGAYRTMKNPTDDYVPERTKRKWATEEYFDKLTYLKYMGLYREAARRALDEEGVDVEKSIENMEKNDQIRDAARAKLKKIKQELHDLKDSPQKTKMRKEIQRRLNLLDDDKTLLKGGEYTHSALIYHQAAMATMTALQKGSSWSQMVTALPTNDREYFMEFVKERDPDKRNEILSKVSPQLRKALNLAWGKGDYKTQDEIEDEAINYFDKSGTPLPDAAWYGWRPDVDLKDVQVKTVENEAMNLSDFGFYESQLRDEKVIHAPSIYDNGGDSHDNMSGRIRDILYGSGLENVEVNVMERAYGSGNQVFAALKCFVGMGEMQKRVNGVVMDGMSGMA